jgi:hypothetical protein
MKNRRCAFTLSVRGLGTIRWTAPRTGDREIFSTPAAVRDALPGIGRGIAPEPFRFTPGERPRAKCVV